MALVQGIAWLKASVAGSGRGAKPAEIGQTSNHLMTTGVNFYGLLRSTNNSLDGNTFDHPMDCAVAVKVDLGNMRSLLSHRQGDCLPVFTVEFDFLLFRADFLLVCSEPTVPHSFNVPSSY
jgi:hypothetical protein